MAEEAVAPTVSVESALMPLIPFWDDKAIYPDRMRSLPSLRYGYPDGWMNALELRTLYNLAFSLQGPFLEVGPWLGRSTSAICAGIRDAAKPERTIFDIVDFGHTSPAEWLRDFGRPFDPDLAGGVAADAIYHPGGSIAVLVNNLKRNGLLEFATTIIRGNFLDMPIERRYRFIFCDTTHDEREVDLYLPKLARLAAPGAVLVFDDVISEKFAAQICAHLRVQKYYMLHNFDRYAKLLLVLTALC